jgi:molybdopterin-guanine dinucleotide biosynthesis protein A
LAAKPLIEHAVTKLGRVCADVQILAGAEGEHSGLAKYAALVLDLHPGCGPISGVEAALAHTTHDWNLILAVDMPFLPAALLEQWVEQVVAYRARGVRIALFSVLGVRQPTLLLIHREAGAPIAGAVARCEWKLVSGLESVARELALVGGRDCAEGIDILQIDEICLRTEGGASARHRAFEGPDRGADRC